MNADIGLRALLCLLAAYHLLIGLASITSLRWTARISGQLYGIKLDTEPQLRHAIRMLGLYALTIGILLSLAALHPQDHRDVIVAITFLQGARGVFRLTFNRTMSGDFQASPRRNAVNAGVLLAEAALLGYWLPS